MPEMPADSSAPPPARPAPWDDRIPALREEHGPYAGYAAWEAWMNDVIDRELDAMGEVTVLESLDTLPKVWLFNLMHRLAVGVPIRPATGAAKGGPS